MQDFSQYVLVLAVIAGATELITRLRAKDLWVAATILCAVAIGALFGLSNYYPDLDAVEGAVLGFGASGTLTAIGSLGNKSNATKRTEVVRK